MYIYMYYDLANARVNISETVERYQVTYYNVYTYAYTYMCLCMSIFIYLVMCVYIYMYIYTQPYM